MSSIRVPKNGSGRTPETPRAPETIGRQVHPHIRRPDTPDRVKALTARTKQRLRRLQSQRVAVERDLKSMRTDDLRLTLRRGRVSRLRTLRRQIRETLSALAVLVNHGAVRPSMHDPSTCCLCIAERGEK